MMTIMTLSYYATQNRQLLLILTLKDVPGRGTIMVCEVEFGGDNARLYVIE